jgi:[ribosomal protein S5]-alanine N-acetyltransferase
MLSSPPTIVTSRLTLRIVEKSDLPALLEMNGDNKVTQFLPYATWHSLDDADAWFQRMQNLQATGTALQFVVIDKSNGKAVGTCLLFKFDEGSARAELGYVLAQAYWHKGYMQEALRGLIDCAFSIMGLRRLEAEVNPKNEASARLLQTIGFTKEGVLRQRWVDRGEGEAYDVAVYGLLKHEYIF